MKKKEKKLKTKKSRKLIIKESIICLSAFVVAGVSTYFGCRAMQGLVQNSPDVTLDQLNADNNTLTRGQKLLTSMSSMKQVNIDAKVNFTYETDMTTGYLNVSGALDASDLTKLKIGGTLDASYGGSKINGDLSFYNDTVYLDYNDTHLSLDNPTISSFMGMLPDLGTNIALPLEITNLDFNDVLAKLDKSEGLETSYGYVFDYNLTEALPEELRLKQEKHKDVILSFKSDKDVNFTGVMTNKIIFHNLAISLNVDITYDNVRSEFLVDPLSKGIVYQSFSPVVNLLDTFQKVFNSKTQTLNVDVDLKSNGLQGVKTLLDLKGDVSYDLLNKDVSFQMMINDSIRHHDLGLHLRNDHLYINHQDVNKVSFENSTIVTLVDYLLSQINIDSMNSSLNTLALDLNQIDFNAILKNLNNLNTWIKNIETSEGKLIVYLDLSIFEFGAGEFRIELSAENTSKVCAIKLVNFNINGYTLNLSLTTAPYVMPSVITSEYAAIDPIANLVPTVLNLLQERNFNVALNSKISSTLPAVNDINLNGNVQFKIGEKVNNVAPFDLYGSLSLVDRDAFTHNVQLDLDAQRALKVVYNNKLKFSMAGAAFDDVKNTISKILSNPDQHFIELFGQMIANLLETPLFAALNGDIGAAINSLAIKNINVTQDKIECDIGAALMGLSDDFHVCVRYKYNNKVELTKIIGVDITNLKLSTNVISLSLDLVDFDTNLDNNRLSDVYKEGWYSLDHLDLFLNMGINTSKYNDFHLTGALNLKIILTELNLIGLDIRVKDNAGDVKVQGDITNIPVIGIFNGSEIGVKNNSRNASLYYSDGLIYLKRVDVVKENIWVWDNTCIQRTRTVVVTPQAFMDNIVYYLGDFIFGLKDSIMKQITKTQGPKQQIIYQDVLTDLYYDETATKFGINLDLAALSTNKVTGNLALSVFADPMTSLLKGIFVDANVSVGIKIHADADIKLVDVGQEVDLSALINHVALHSGDTQGQVLINDIKI